MTIPTSALLLLPKYELSQIIINSSLVELQEHSFFVLLIMIPLLYYLLFPNEQSTFGSAPPFKQFCKIPITHMVPTVRCNQKRHNPSTLFVAELAKE